MPRAKYERTLQATSNGNVVVLSEGTAEFRTPGGDLIPLFDAREGGSALGNPVTADSSGRVRVYFEAQRFRVRQRSSDSTIDETVVDEIALADATPETGTQSDQLPTNADLPNSSSVGTQSDHDEPEGKERLARLDRLEAAGASISPDAERPSFFSTFDDYTPIGPPLDPAVWNGGFGLVLASTGQGSGVAGMHMAWSDRVRFSQVLPYMGGYMALYSSGAGDNGTSITTSVAFSQDGYTWWDSPANPILDQLDQDWQGGRCYGISLVWDDDNSRWALFVIGNDESGDTPGDRASGVFFSEDGMMTWTASSSNPIFTINSDGAQESFGDGTVDRVYVRSVVKKDGVWHALVTVHGDDDASDRKMVAIMLTATDLEGPWSSGDHNPIFTDADWDEWNKTIGVHTIIRYRGSYYMAVLRSDRGGAGSTHRKGHGIAKSDDLLNWQVMHSGPLNESSMEMETPVLFPLRTHWGILFGQRNSPRGQYLTTSHINANLVQAITNQDTVS